LWPAECGCDDARLRWADTERDAAGRPVQMRVATRPPAVAAAAGCPGPASGAAAHPALKFALGDAVRCEECRDLVSSTGSGRTRRASPAASWKPVLRSVKAKCSREYCIVTTKLWSSCSQSVGHAWESPVIKVDAHGQRIGACRR
jgi:hypothetical protein